eukprot:TRINITY_DN2117_c0_g3_i4.p1 TRINITY_DN2117_c0_g3~~TRINITY_DN2117_c0_g3_i4.p1  ORF type:complete len:174 (-),score=42.62 TRINITY_DN2117_c0_g3_i4:134-655(-)
MDGQVQLKNLLTELEGKGYDLSQAAVFFYSRKYEEYVPVLNDPKFVIIPTIIRLKVVFELEGGVSEIVTRKKKLKVGRIKEKKTIENIMLKEYQWNKLYRLTGNRKKAADILGMRRKTLDDYSQQIKNGLKYGFDFDAKRNESFGVLRGFVKKAKREKKEMLNEVKHLLNDFL